MPNVINFPDNKKQLSFEKLYPIFLEIKKHTDELLSQYNEKRFSKDPSVEIKEVVLNNGIKNIIEVPKSELPKGRNACLKNGIIYVCKDDSEEEKRFSIAHEMAHYVLEKSSSVVNKIPNFVLIEGKRTSIVNEITPFVFKKEEELIAARLKLSQEELIAASLKLPHEEVLEENKKAISEEIAKGVYKGIEKNVSRKKAYIFYEEQIDEIYKKVNKADMIKTLDGKMTLDEFKKKIIKTVNNDIETAIKKAIEKTRMEEIADYFAANLLVPTERFLLWKNKENEEIAKAFMVSVECIKKRKEEEIELEYDFLAQTSFSSNVVVEELISSSINEFEHHLEDRNNNASWS